MWPGTLLLQPRDSSQGFDSPDPMKRVQSRTIQALHNSSQDLSRSDPAQLQRIWAGPKYSSPRPRTVEPSTLPYPTTTSPPPFYQVNPISLLWDSRRCHISDA